MALVHLPGVLRRYDCEVSAAVLERKDSNRRPMRGTSSGPRIRQRRLRVGLPRSDQVALLAAFIGLPIVWYHGDRGEQRLKSTELMENQLILAALNMTLALETAVGCTEHLNEALVKLRQARCGSKNGHDAADHPREERTRARGPSAGTPHSSPRFVESGDPSGRRRCRRTDDRSCRGGRDCAPRRRWTAACVRNPLRPCAVGTQRRGPPFPGLPGRSPRRGGRRLG